MKVAAQKTYFGPEGIDFILREFKEILEGKSFLTLGKHGEALEKRFAQYVGATRALCTNSGTSAVELALRCLDVRGSEVIVPTNTFAATIFAVIGAGGIPVFADCLPDLTVDPDDVAKRLTPKTKGVVTVHIGGLVSPATHTLVDWCQSKGLFLVEDAAHAHGSALNGKRAGAFGVAGAFSFFSTKVMTTGEGGMMTTSDEAIAKRAAVIRDQAKVDNQNIQHELGYNWRMSEVHALMGLAQLARLDDFIKRRQELAKIYWNELEGCKNLELLKTPEGCHHNYYKCLAYVKKGIDREHVKARVKKEFDVALGGYVYDIPCHEQKAFAPYAKDRLPRAEDLCRRHIALPTYFVLSDEEAQFAGRSLRSVMESL